MSDYLKTYLEKNSLIHNTQSGFRSNHSCETAFTEIIDTWIDAINNKKVIGTVFLDLTKAFYLINHPLLFNNMFEYNIRNKAQNGLTLSLI